MIMWTWKGGEGGVWKDGEGGEEVNRSHSGKHAKGDISLLPVLKRLPTPSFLLLYFPLEGIRVGFSFERGNPSRMR